MDKAALGIGAGVFALSALITRRLGKLGLVASLALGAYASYRYAHAPKRTPWKVALDGPKLVDGAGARARGATLPLREGAIDLYEGSPAGFYKLRQRIHHHLVATGVEGQLAYRRMDSNDDKNQYQLVPYKLGTWGKIPGAGLAAQCQVLYRTIFGCAHHDGTVAPISEIHLPSELPKTGQGPLIDEEVVGKQRVLEGKTVNVLYNYAPLKVGGEEIHFLIVPREDRPAKDFSELDQDQYVEVLSMIRKISTYAFDEIQNTKSVHIFEKTGKIAGQTQPIFHTHVVVVQGEGESLGKLDMFKRMVWPVSPLPADELQRRVAKWTTAFQTL